MLIFDTLTITVCGVLLLIAVATPFCNVLFRRPDLDSESSVSNGKSGENMQMPGFSIIIPVHNNAMEIERNLPGLLEQEYSGKYEVIVVDESSNDETEDVLKRLKSQYANLYTTFIPDTSHYLSRRKLSITIGVKAAKYPWLVIMSADCHPSSNNWLATMALHCDNNIELILGETRYDDNATDYERLDNIKSWFRQLKKAQNSTAYAYCGRNLAVRRDIFMKHNGFLKNLKFLRGEYDFLVNEYATPYNTSVATESDALVIREAPTKKGWINEKLFFIMTSRHLERSMAYHLPVIIDTVLLHATFVALVAAIGVSAVFGLYIITAAAGVSLIFNYLIKMWIASKAMKAIDEDISAWKIPFLELSEIWRNMFLNIKFLRSNKEDFIRR